MSDLLNSDHHDSEPVRSRRIFPWLLMLIVVAAGGAFFWANSRADKDSSFKATVQSKPEPPPASQDDTKQAIDALRQTANEHQSAITDVQRQLSAEQGQLKLVVEQVGALAARTDALERANAGPPAKRGKTR